MRDRALTLVFMVDKLDKEQCFLECALFFIGVRNIYLIKAVDRVYRELKGLVCVEPLKAFLKLHSRLVLQKRLLVMTKTAAIEVPVTPEQPEQKVRALDFERRPGYMLIVIISEDVVKVSFFVPILDKPIVNGTRICCLNVDVHRAFERLLNNIFVIELAIKFVHIVKCDVVSHYGENFASILILLGDTYDSLYPVF